MHGSGVCVNLTSRAASAKMTAAQVTYFGQGKFWAIIQFTNCGALALHTSSSALSLSLLPFALF